MKTKEETKPEVRKPEEVEPRRDDLPEYIPDADIYEFEDHYLLAVDLPGVDEAHARVQLTENVLEVTGEPVVEDPGNHQLLHQGCYAGRYRRAFELGDRIDRAGFKASLKNGTLRIVLPKAKAAKPITIRVEG